MTKYDARSRGDLIGEPFEDVELNTSDSARVPYQELEVTLTDWGIQEGVQNRKPMTYWGGLCTAKIYIERKNLSRLLDDIKTLLEKYNQHY